MRSFVPARRALVACFLPLVACGSNGANTADASIGSKHDATVEHRDAPGGFDADIADVKRGESPPPMTDFCKLPGSVVWKGGTPTVVPGGAALPDGGLDWMTLPDGFCSHYFATVPEVRQLRFSPSGDLFAASPSTACAGGATGGTGAVVVLPDDNHDGVADTTLTYLGNLPSTQGLLFNGGYLYYQDNALIRRTPYKNGDRTGTVGEQVIDVTIYSSSLHWPRAIDADDDGNIFVTNGGDNGELCEGEAAELGPNRPFHGGVLQIDGTPNGKLVARGLRNAIALRCAKGTGVCFGLELALDFAASQGSREKLFPVHDGDDWGFPCCATANEPYSQYTMPGVTVPDCANVNAEDVSFVIDHTPFGLDFEEGYWPVAWKYRAFVVFHGVFGSWVGARVVGIETDPRTGWPVRTSEPDAGSTPEMTDFATGWDDGMMDHGRPAVITFAPDGRMFVGNDLTGLVVWIAPVTSSG